jgi:hypothetical protein
VRRMPATRREALAAAGAGIGAAAFAGTASAAIDKDLQKKLEKAAVSSATFGELTKTVAFEAIANGRLLGPRETATIRVLKDHAALHATLLTTLMKDALGADAPLAPKRAAVPGLLAAHDRDAALRLALELERRAIGRHMAAVRVARDAQVMRSLAAIVGSDGQHLVLVRQLLHQEALPSAFETGIR